MNKIVFSLEEVPPPAAAPIYPTAEALGLCRGLRVERHTMFRCANCESMQPKGSLIVWIADGTEIGDPGWSIEERERENAFNGSGSGWCLKCAKKLCKPRWWKFW